MNKILNFSRETSILFLLFARYNKADTHVCYVGPDGEGIYIQKIVTADFAASCDACECIELREICILGPDSLGNYATAEVQATFARSCPRSTCTCESHENFAEIGRDRISQANEIILEEVGVLLEPPDIDESNIIVEDPEIGLHPFIDKIQEDEAEQEEEVGDEEEKEENQQELE